LSNYFDLLFALPLTSAAQPGRPGEPQCEDIAKDSITLSWELPTDDGGKPITGYIVEKREHGSDEWTKYVSPLNTSTLHVNFSVRLSLRHVMCGRNFAGSCRFTLILSHALIKPYHFMSYQTVRLFSDPQRLRYVYCLCIKVRISFYLEHNPLTTEKITK